MFKIILFWVNYVNCLFKFLNVCGIVFILVFNFIDIVIINKLFWFLKLIWFNILILYVIIMLNIVIIVLFNIGSGMIFVNVLSLGI